MSNITSENLLVENWSGAVVFLVVENYLVLIKRSDTMPTHKGQMAFMGGHKKKSEIHPFETALREFEEESGLVASDLEIHGLIYPVLTTAKRLIIPVLASYPGAKEDFLSLAQSNGEWNDLVLVPLEYLSNTELWSRGRVTTENPYHVYFAPLMKEHCIYLSEHKSEPYLLWGATAKMILNFFQKHLDDDTKPA